MTLSDAVFSMSRMEKKEYVVNCTYNLGYDLVELSFRCVGHELVWIMVYGSCQVKLMSSMESSVSLE